MVFLPLLSFGQQRWETSFSDEDYAVVTNTLSYDGGELISAAIGGNGSGKSIILKLDKNGKELWQKQLFFDNGWAPSGIKQNNNGELVVYGETAYKASLVFLDACGNLLWCNEFLNNTTYTETFYTDAVFLENGNIVAIIQVVSSPGNYDIGLISFDLNGDFQWFHPFNMLQKYPTLKGMILCWHLEKFDGFLMLSGFGYYSYPENPNLGYLKPMYVKTDLNFNEEWLLPYGLTENGASDTILGDARGVFSYKNGIFHGWGSSARPQGSTTSTLMYFDSIGKEKNCYIIKNEMIDSTVTTNFFLDVAVRDDTSLFTSLRYGNLELENPSAEVIIDTMGNVYQQHAHTNANLQGGIFPLEKDTIGNQYYLAYMNYDWDIVLYKLNKDLSDVPIDTIAYNFDSLCDHPIVSDTIYLNGCDVITGIEDAPSPEQYFNSLKTIPLHISPNPATGNLRFEMENTAYHKNIMVQVFGINGNRIFAQSLADGQTAIATSVASWPDGMYVAVVSSSSGGSGSAKFVVKK